MTERPAPHFEPVVAEDIGWFAIDGESAVGTARRAAMALGRTLGFSEERVAEVGIAVTEAATNHLKHARTGVIALRRLRYEGDGGVEFVAADAGPGMRQVAESAVDGRSTTGTLGIGLGAIRRLATRSDIHSLPGQGTVLVATFWDGPAPEDRGDFAGLTRPMTGEDVCGDAYAGRRHGETTVLLLVDGLGHGPLAAGAAHAAVALFGTLDETDPAAVIQRLHAGISHTRGVAAAVATIERSAGRLRYAGVGNISGTLVHPEGRNGLISHPGIVGHQTRTVREVALPLPPESLVVMHSDGVTDRWNLADYPGLRHHDPLVVGATLLRDAAIRRDDASVLVARR